MKSQDGLCPASQAGVDVNLNTSLLNNKPYYIYYTFGEKLYKLKILIVSKNPGNIQSSGLVSLRLRYQKKIRLKATFNQSVYDELKRSNHVPGPFL